MQAMFPNPLPASNAILLKTLAGLVGEDRASKLANANARSYALDGNNGDAFRETLERIITDGTWRCPNRDVAAKWAESGGRVWVGEFVAGTTYPTNKDGDYCTKAGRVCHEVSSSWLSSLLGPADQVQDDIFSTFGGGSPVSLPSEKYLKEHLLIYRSGRFSHRYVDIVHYQPRPRAKLETVHRRQGRYRQGTWW